MACFNGAALRWSGSTAQPHTWYRGLGCFNGAALRWSGSTHVTVDSYPWLLCFNGAALRWSGSTWPMVHHWLMPTAKRWSYQLQWCRSQMERFNHATGDLLAFNFASMVPLSDGAVQPRPNSHT